MMKQTTDLKLDVRTRERALREGSLTKEELSKYLKSLPDESANTEDISVSEEEKPAVETRAGKPAGGGPTFSAIEG